MGKLQPPFFALFWIFRRRRPCHYYLSSGLISLSLSSPFFSHLRFLLLQSATPLLLLPLPLSFCLCESAYEKKNSWDNIHRWQIRDKREASNRLFFAQSSVGESENQLHNFGVNPIPVSLSLWGAGRRVTKAKKEEGWETNVRVPVWLKMRLEADLSRKVEETIRRESMWCDLCVWLESGPRLILYEGERETQSSKIPAVEVRKWFIFLVFGSLSFSHTEKGKSKKRF